METFTIAQTAKILQADERTVRRWIAEGDLKAFRIGRLIRISKAALDDVMRAGV